MDLSRLSSISRADTGEGMGEFWDTHDFTDYDTDAPDVEFEIRCAVPIDVELLGAVEEHAHRHGVQVETLVNLWLQQKLLDQTQGVAAQGGSQQLAPDAANV